MPILDPRIYAVGIDKREISKLASFSVPDSPCRSCGAELPVASICRICGGLLLRGCKKCSTVSDASNAECRVRL